MSAQDDWIIAVMGPTGSGKSTFIATATGRSDKDGGVGHELESKTDQVRAMRCAHPNYPGRNVVFVDTPGFDDSHKSDAEILKMIAEWLKKEYKKGKTLKGIIYLHRISDNRMGGSPLRNLRMFGQLCGTKAVPNVVLGTTMWSKVKLDVGEQREQELTTKYWAAMMDQGASMQRFLGTHGSAWQIVDGFTDLKGHSLLVQQEMVDVGKRLSETKAGLVLYEELQRLMAKQHDLMTKLQEQARAQNNPAIAQELEREYQETERRWKATLDSAREWKIPFSRKLAALFNWRKPSSQPIDL